MKKVNFQKFIADAKLGDVGVKVCTQIRHIFDEEKLTPSEEIMLLAVMDAFVVELVRKSP
jgi:hypothetical protein